MDPQECMYVCLRRPSMYVCMYVCMFEALKHVCMPQTYIHKSNIHTQLVDLPYRKAFPGALERVCMFENPLPVMENCFKHTYMHAQKQVCVATKILLKHLLSLYVCFKSLSLSWK